MFSYACSNLQCLPDGPRVPFRTGVCRNHRLALELYCPGDCPAPRADSRMIVDAATRTGRGRRNEMIISACKARPRQNPLCGMLFLIFRPQDENDKLNWKLMPSQICAHTLLQCYLEYKCLLSLTGTTAIIPPYAHIIHCNSGCGVVHKQIFVGQISQVNVYWHCRRPPQLWYWKPTVRLGFIFRSIATTDVTEEG